MTHRSKNLNKTQAQKKIFNEENYTKAYQNQNFKTNDKERILKAARGKMKYCMQRYKNYYRIFVRNNKS